MLTKNNTKVNYISRILVLPLAVIVFAAFTLKAKAYHHGKLPEGKVYTVVVDAGHGGTDNGAKGSDGSLEKDIVLGLVKKIKLLNDDERIKIILTRDADIYQDPKQKAAFATKQGADLFISVHCDYQPNDKAGKFSGLTAWTSPSQVNNGSESILLASAVLASFKNNYSLPVLEEPMQRPVGIWVLKQSKCPAVLIESGFINNKTDRDYLKSDEGQTQFAKNVLQAIENYLVSREDIKTAAAAAVNDTVPVTPVKAKLSNVTMLLNGEFFSKGKGAKQKMLYIINGKEYSAAELENKKIIGKTGRVYEKGNDEMIKKYGAKATDGVLVLEGATIVDAGTGDHSVYVQLDSMYMPKQQEDLPLKPVTISTATNNGSHPVYVLDGKIVDTAAINSISPENIRKINIVNRKEAVAKYGDKAKDGAVEIFLKQSLDLPVKAK